MTTSFRVNCQDDGGATIQHNNSNMIVVCLCPSSLDKRSWTRSLEMDMRRLWQQTANSSHHTTPKPSSRLTTNKIQAFEIKTKILLLQCGWDRYIVVFLLCMCGTIPNPIFKSMQNSHKVFQGFLICIWMLHLFPCKIPSALEGPFSTWKPSTI